MAKLILQKAQKTLKPLKIFLYGPTYSGKTYTSLMLANGMVQEIRQCSEEDAWKHILFLDTEYGRGALYSNVGEYNYFQITAPYTTDKLIDLVSQANNMPEIDVIIIDSMSHFWVKKGGILDAKSQADKQGGNSYTNWQEFTMKFNEMLDVLLESPKHMFLTARAKSDTVLIENAQGKMAPKTYGLKPEIRDGFEYECDITFNVDKESHSLLMEKGITGMTPVYEAATYDLGKELYRIHIQDAKVRERTTDEVADSIRTLSQGNQALIKFVQLSLKGRKLSDLDLAAITQIETDLIAEVKKNQAKR
jgi:hypothetical protein